MGAFVETQALVWQWAPRDQTRWIRGTASAQEAGIPPHGTASVRGRSLGVLQSRSAAGAGGRANVVMAENSRQVARTRMALRQEIGRAVAHAAQQAAVCAPVSRERVRRPNATEPAEGMDATTQERCQSAAGESRRSVGVRCAVKEAWSSAGAGKFVLGDSGNFRGGRPQRSGGRFPCRHRRAEA